MTRSRPDLRDVWTLYVAKQMVDLQLKPKGETTTKKKNNHLNYIILLEVYYNSKIIGNTSVDLVEYFVVSKLENNEYN